MAPRWSASLILGRFGHVRRILEQVGAQLLERTVPMRDCILLSLVHLCVRFVIPIRLKDRIPTKVSGSTRRDNGPMGASGECDRLRPGSRAEGKHTKRVPALVVVCREQIVEANMTSLL